MKDMQDAPTNLEEGVKYRLRIETSYLGKGKWQRDKRNGACLTPQLALSLKKDSVRSRLPSLTRHIVRIVRRLANKETLFL